MVSAGKSGSEIRTTGRIGIRRHYSGYVTVAIFRRLRATACRVINLYYYYFRLVRLESRYTRDITLLVIQLRARRTCLLLSFRLPDILQKKNKKKIK